jgi:xylulokinase
MSDAPLLVGIDFGTTNLKAIVFDAAGSVVAGASLPTPWHYPRPGWAYCDPEEMWQTTANAIRNAVAQVERPERIVSVAVASIGETGVPLDAHGRPTYDAIGWFDARTKPQAEWLDRQVGRDRIFAITGMSLVPIFSLCKFLWIREHAPEAWARTVRWLNTADYIAYRLGGACATDYSLACRTLTLNLHSLQWEDSLLAELGFAADLMAPLADSGTRLGTVSAEAAALTGLPATACVATGGHDHVCGAMAVGVTRPGLVLNSMGTTEGIFLPVAKPLTDPVFGREGYNQGALSAGMYYTFGAHYTSGACIDWFRESFAAKTDYATLIAEAEKLPTGSLGVFFLSHLLLANAPYDDAKARGAFIGLTTDTKRDALFRAVLEGIAMETRLTLEPLQKYTGLDKLDDIYAIGGGTRNGLLMRIKASIQQQPIRVMSVDESAALGAALLGGVAAGVYPDVAGAVAAMKYTETVVEPTPADVAYYDAAYRGVYEHMYRALRPLNHGIYELQAKYHGQ